jgi:predicted outer membrane repeat protein
MCEKQIECRIMISIISLPYFFLSPCAFLVNFHARFCFPHYLNPFMLHLRIWTQTYTHIQSGCVFQDNRAFQYEGGAISSIYDSNITIGSDALFDRNQAVAEGGAILAVYSYLALGDNTRIQSSQSNTTGGGIFLLYFARLVVGKNVSFNNNTGSGQVSSFSNFAVAYESGGGGGGGLNGGAR